MAIHQEVSIKCDPKRIYTTLTRDAEFSKATGAKADISAEEGGRFSCFDGQIQGRNLELQADRMIVQAWRAGVWPDGAYSIVRITLEPDGNTTRLVLDHSGFPEGAEEHLEGGWYQMYWDPLKAYCE